MTGAGTGRSETVTDKETSSTTGIRAAWSIGSTGTTGYSSATWSSTGSGTGFVFATSLASATFVFAAALGAFACVYAYGADPIETKTDDYRFQSRTGSVSVCPPISATNSFFATRSIYGFLSSYLPYHVPTIGVPRVFPSAIGKYRESRTQVINTIHKYPPTFKWFRNPEQTPDYLKWGEPHSTTTYAHYLAQPFLLLLE